LCWSEASQRLGRMVVNVLGSYISRAVRKVNRRGREFHKCNGRVHRPAGSGDPGLLSTTDIHPCLLFSTLGRKACCISG
jgi:hypothetical protein